MKKFDIGIVGSGVAGSYAIHRLISKFKVNAIVFDYGRPPSKRRKRQLEGYLGCFPIGDGKLYQDTSQLKTYLDGRTVRSSEIFVKSHLEKIGPWKIESKQLSAKTESLIKDNGWSIQNDDYVQWTPESVHSLSKDMSEQLFNTKVELSFDNEVFEIVKFDGGFKILTENGDYFCKKVLLAVGRSGWRWANEVFSKLGINYENNDSNYGIRFELSNRYLKNFNKAPLTLRKKDYTIGPLSWSGKIIPEDHADFVTSSFRSNENRWKSAKVSFAFSKCIKNPKRGQEETERAGKLAYLMFEDRVNKEKVKLITKNNSKLSQLPVYDWLNEGLNDIECLFPDLKEKAYYYSPYVVTKCGKVNFSSRLETELEGFFVAGETAGFDGIINSAISGVVAAEGLMK